MARTAPYAETTLAKTLGVMNPIDTLLNLLLSPFRPIGTPDEAAPEPPDRISGVTGLHVLSDYGSDHEHRSNEPEESTIIDLMNSLEWDCGFYQVVLVLPTGESMEVGGSLDPDDGLSSSYRNDAQGIHRVTEDPPTTVNEMTNVLLSFHRGDNQWEEMFNYQ
jgi:hypothetical protein